MILQSISGCEHFRRDSRPAAGCELLVEKTHSDTDEAHQNFNNSPEHEAASLYNGTNYRKAESGCC
jgi:heme-degrading monooxygenase HmoA